MVFVVFRGGEGQVPNLGAAAPGPPWLRASDKKR